MAYNGAVLIVDDEEIALRNLQHLMNKEGYQVPAVQNGVDALRLIHENRYDVILTDLRMEKVDGMQILQSCRQLHPNTEVIMITGFATTDTAVEAMKQGAFYYIAKPFRIDEVRKVVREAMEKVGLRLENQRLRQQVEAISAKTRIITQDATMQHLLSTAQQIAPTDCTVLITGDSGTGKELFARFIHEQSQRNLGPYLAVNCGAFNKDLLANELFGHVKEAFTGATSAKKGLIEAAAGGTLFLDEITEMSLEMQVKLLRVLQEKEVMRLGATEAIKTDIRVIAATNRDLTTVLQNGSLRQDLYFRLNVVQLHIPPLAQRRADIPLLINYFLQKYAAEMRKDVQGISPAALARLNQYDYPGNVRELENIIARGTALCVGTLIDVQHLPENLYQASDLAPASQPHRLATLDEHEQDYIRWVLDQVGGNQSLAAQTLGINRSSLWRKLKAIQNK